MGDVRERLVAAERRLFDRYDVTVEAREVWLDDPPLRVRVLECGTGEPVVLVHGSGMLGSTWAPLLPHLEGRRVLAVDLPGFGLSDRYDYTGRSLRRHAVAQLRSLVDALGLSRADLVGTSLGGMWSLCFALEHPERVKTVVSLGVPAVALPGIHGDPWFTLVSRRGIGAVVVRVKPPSTRIARRSFVDVAGRAAVDRTPDEWFEVVRLGMRVPRWSRAMRSHMLLALRAGRPLPENFLTDDELHRMRVPVLFIWGEDDVYGPPEIAERAVQLMPQARLERMPGNHAPFLDDPERCGRLIADFGRLAREDSARVR
jgi:pimeloyl-ACP methyl ester carboxylesterase